MHPHVSPLARALLCAALLAAGPAVAGDGRGNDFCDNANPLPGLPIDPDGGACEVNMLKDRPSAFDPAGGLRLHDLVWARLQRPPASVYEPVDLPVQVGNLGFSNGEALIEWSFESVKTGERRVLALSLWRESDAKPGVRLPTRVLAQWYAVAAPDWSLADPHLDLPGDQSMHLVDLSPGVALSQFRLFFDGRQVAVAVENEQTGHAFALPGEGWRPVRLRNAILSTRPMPSGQGLRLYWPLELFGP